jgi:L-ascorbate metabolism protein UlaG (beta-lactamase superfamily)
MDQDTSNLSVTFINHASVVVETPEFQLLTDPWFFGSVFNDSWRLLIETTIDNLDLSKLRFIWISHEHPDHFHIPTLRALRQRVTWPVTVLFQRLPDKGVKHALQQLGYDVLELQNGTSQELAADFSVQCFQSGSDSALVIHANGKHIANLNDCAMTNECLVDIERCCDGKVDLLLTQFGLAGYYANSDDEQALQIASSRHLEQILLVE